MKRSLIACILVGSSLVVQAVGWKGLEESNYYCGPKITDKDLAGKVVLVDCWGVNCGPCRMLLPKLQAIWQDFRGKPFMLIGAHWQGRQPEKVKELVDANKLTYPIYDRAGIQNEPKFVGLPFFYVVDTHGKIIFQGDGVKGTEAEAREAIKTALKGLNAPLSIAPGIVFSKKSPYKSLEPKMALGKPAAPIIKKLENDIAKSKSKTASAQQKAQAEEAEEILKAIESAREDYKTDIENAKESNPVEALKIVKGYMVSFPEEGAAYKDELPDLVAAAKEAEAKAKAEAAAKKKSAKSGKK